MNANPSRRLPLHLVGGAAAVAISATSAGALTCQAIEGGGSFTPSQVREVAAAAVAARGSEMCDVVYHIDGHRYELGGCNRQYVGEWAKSEGAPIGRRHGRLPLTCQ
jgi:hypothetical protein